MSTTRETLLGGPNASANQPGSWRTPATTGPRILRKIFCLDDFEEPARRYIPRPIFGYIVSGSETNASIRANRAAYDDLAFVPRVLVDTGERTQKTILFGRTYDSPFGFSPMGGNSLAAYQGDLVLARAAAKANIPMILSGGALTPLEKVREVGPTAWFQAYLPGERGPITQLVERVARAGYDTLCVTVDVSAAANLEFSARSGFRRPFRPTLRLAWDGITRPKWLFGVFARTLLLQGVPHFENTTTPRSPVITLYGERDRGRLDKLSWPHLELIRRLWKGHLVVKGILNKEDARIARESGVDGVIVSNHGGRQLDGAISPLRVLPGIASDAGGMTVMIDSGIRRGTDVLKALALGAQFAFIGRPILYAAAIGGESGVHHAVKLLRDEIHRDMALLGITTLTDMRRDRLMDARSFDGGVNRKP
ncbi:MAG: alpha-hydroxy-acid oxidizing protein [Betaproteobacteria bacterium]|nr:alpha-hydroxy-acid oxidizing protein [Betaproteobacteria bacterium]